MVTGAAGELGPVARAELAVGAAGGTLDVVTIRKVSTVRVGAMPAAAAAAAAVPAAAATAAVPAAAAAVPAVAATASLSSP